MGGTLVVRNYAQHLVVIKGTWLKLPESLKIYRHFTCVAKPGTASLTYPRRLYHNFQRLCLLYLNGVLSESHGPQDGKRLPTQCICDQALSFRLCFDSAIRHLRFPSYHSSLPLLFPIAP